jgi:hypothetical protein
MAAAKVTRSVSAVWLVGGTEETFKHTKLPSRGDVLKVLFHHHTGKHMNLKDSIAKTAELLLPIWEKARLPTKAPNHVTEHIVKLHAEWQGLKKLINRTSDKNLLNQQMFRESLDDLFDVAHRDAMSIIQIEEDKQFLTAQREKGRRGTIGGVDRTLTLREERVMKRKLAAENHAMKLKAQAEGAAAATVVGVSDDSYSDTAGEDSDTQEELFTFTSSNIDSGPSTPKKPQLRGTIPIVTPEVAAALDRTNISDRKAAHIFSAMASTSQLQPDVEELIISPSAIRRARIKHRETFATEIKASFEPSVPLILHWDGKIMDDLTGPGPGRERVDRLPILVSGQNVIKLLSVPKLHDGTAVTMAHAVVENMDEWGLRNRIQGLCFDTTSSNTGVNGGVCILLETEIGRQLLNLACRHHISEIVLEKVFSLHDVSKSPNIEVFSHFRDFWPRIDQASFSTAMDDEITAAVIIPWKYDIMEFAVAQLNEVQPRDDYRELLELCIIFLGGIPPRGVKFLYPGAIHRARWMARAIYSIKMWLFRKQYNAQLIGGNVSQKSRGRGPSQNDKLWHHLQEVSLFVAAIYVKYWFQSPSSTAAPKNDLALLRALSVYPNPDVAKAASKGFGNHLWYLSELLIGFSFFDEEVSAEEKVLMVAALKGKDGSDNPLKRIPPVLEPATKELHDFVTKSTMNFFTILGLSQDFLEHHPTEWRNHEAFQKNQDVVKSVKVVNDLAERGVALIQEFNASITRNEEQKQYLLQVVEEHRKTFSAPTKTGAIKRALSK